MRISRLVMAWGVRYAGESDCVYPAHMKPHGVHQEQDESLDGAYNRQDTTRHWTHSAYGKRTVRTLASAPSRTPGEVGIDLVGERTSRRHARREAEGVERAGRGPSGARGHGDAGGRDADDREDLDESRRG